MLPASARRPAEPPRAMFVRHSPGAATRSIAPTTSPAANNDPQVETGRRNERLHEHALPAKPGALAKAAQARLSCRRDSHSRRPPPAAETRFQAPRGTRRAAAACPKRRASRWVRNSQPPEPEGSLELVMAGDERAAELSTSVPRRPARRSSQMPSSTPSNSASRPAGRARRHSARRSRVNCAGSISCARHTPLMERADEQFARRRRPSGDNPDCARGRLDLRRGMKAFEIRSHVAPFARVRAQVRRSERSARHGGRHASVWGTRRRAAQAGWRPCGGAL